MKKRRTFPYLSCLLFLGVCIGVYMGIMESEQSNQKENTQQLEERLNEAIIQCLSIEGEYPSSLQYLKEHYHIYIDEDLYQVDYLYEGGNIKPKLLVMRKDQSYEK